MQDGRWPHVPSTRRQRYVISSDTKEKDNNILNIIWPATTSGQQVMSNLFLLFHKIPSPSLTLPGKEPDLLRRDL